MKPLMGGVVWDRLNIRLLGNFQRIVNFYTQVTDC